MPYLSQKQTIDEGSFSPCGTEVVKVSSMGAESQLEHWKISKAGSKIKCKAQEVRCLRLPSRTTRYFFTWHPTLATKLLYALIELSTVYFIDGSQHMMLFARPVWGSCDPHRSVGEHICWSPDSVRLAVVTSCHVNILQADVL